MLSLFRSGHKIGRLHLRSLSNEKIATFVADVKNDFRKHSKVPEEYLEPMLNLIFRDKHFLENMSNILHNPNFRMCGFVCNKHWNHILVYRLHFINDDSINSYYERIPEYQSRGLPENNVTWSICQFIVQPDSLNNIIMDQNAYPFFNIDKMYLAKE
jgi:hypothetical protein